MRIFFVMISLILLPTIVLAENFALGKGNNLGIAASNINDVVAFIYSVIDVILYIAATILGMSGLMKYRLHRRNPQQVPLSTPVTELAIAAVFLGIAVMVQLSDSYKTVAKPALPQNLSTPTAQQQYPTGSSPYPR